MAKRKTVFRLLLGLACSAAILWLGVGCGEDIAPAYQCGTDSLRQANKTLEVFEKHKRLFNRYPNRVAVKLGFLRDEKTGRRTETWGIVTIVSEVVDQDRLPPEERLPNEIEGVPVQIILAEIAFAGQEFSDASPDERDPHVNLAWSVWNKNRDFFRRHPFYDGSILLGQMDPEPGNRIYGIKVVLTQEVDDRYLRSAVSIPDCLEDVPVKITVNP